MKLLTAAQMRRIEMTAIESGRVTGLTLMERAGAGVVDAIFEEWPEMAPPRPVAGMGNEYLAQEEAPRAVVLCGPGNNGGDGFVVARLLCELGWQVRVFLLGDVERLPVDARANYERWSALGETLPLNLHGMRPEELTVPMGGLLIDALFGTGLTRPLEMSEDLRGFFELFSDDGMTKGARVVSVDIPSGVCADSGRVLGTGGALFSHLTVTFHRRKLGHVLAEGPWRCEACRIVDIGLEPEGGAETAVVETSAAGIELLSKGRRLARGHKYAYGHALVLSGGHGRSGAARLAAQAVLRVGAGVVTLGVPGSAGLEVAAHITAEMMTGVEDGRALAEVLKDERINAVCLGPGLGLDRAQDLVPVALGGGGVKPRPTVLDADALSAFVKAPEDLFALLHPGCVLTPHGGEFARLFPDIAARIDVAPAKGPAYSKVDAAREAAARSGCVVLYKGPDTVIASPEGRCSVNAAVYDRTAPWLATAGAGDVLAGCITGLLARGNAPMQAAELGAWLHVEAARAFGPGLMAGDLPGLLPQVLRDLGV